MFGLAPKRQPTLAETAAEFQALQQMIGQGGEGAAFEPSVSPSGKPSLRPTAEAEAGRQATIASARKRAELEVTQDVSQQSMRKTFSVLQNRLQAISAPSSDVGLATKGIQEFAAKKGFNKNINEYLTATDAVLGQVARSVSQERGNLHNKDIERVAELMKQLPFLSEDSRRLRIETINALMGKMGQPPLLLEDTSGQGGMIRVREKSTGRTGRVPANEFNTSQYEKL